MPPPPTPLSGCPLKRLEIHDRLASKTYDAATSDATLTLSLEGQRSPSGDRNDLVLRAHHGLRRVLSFQLTDLLNAPDGKTDAVSIGKDSQQLCVNSRQHNQKVVATFGEARDFNVATCMLKKFGFQVKDGILASSSQPSVTQDTGTITSDPGPPRLSSITPLSWPGSQDLPPGAPDLSFATMLNSNIPLSQAGTPYGRLSSFPSTVSPLQSPSILPFAQPIALPYSHHMVPQTTYHSPFNPYHVFLGRQFQQPHQPLVGSPLRNSLGVGNSPEPMTTMGSRDPAYPSPSRLSMLQDGRSISVPIVPHVVYGLQGPQLSQVPQTSPAHQYTQGFMHGPAGFSLSQDSHPSSQDTPSSSQSSGCEAFSQTSMETEDPSREKSRQELREMMPQPRELPFVQQDKTDKKKRKKAVTSEAAGETEPKSISTAKLPSSDGESSEADTETARKKADTSKATVKPKPKSNSVPKLQSSVRAKGQKKTTKTKEASKANLNLGSKSKSPPKLHSSDDAKAKAKAKTKTKVATKPEPETKSAPKLQSSDGVKTKATSTTKEAIPKSSGKPSSKAKEVAAVKSSAARSSKTKKVTTAKSSGVTLKTKVTTAKTSAVAASKPAAKAKAKSSSSQGTKEQPVKRPSKNASRTRRASQKDGPTSPISIPSPSKQSTVPNGVLPLAGGKEQPDLSTRPSCQRCRKRKIGCDRQSPCGRCRDAGLSADQCIDGDIPGRKTEDTPATDAAKLPLKRARHPEQPQETNPRTRPKGDSSEEEQPMKTVSKKRSCQRCRKRKMGCDRQRPCGRCRDAGLSADQCLGEDKSAREAENTAATDGANGSLKRAGHPEQPDDTDPRKKRKIDPSRPHPAHPPFTGGSEPAPDHQPLSSQAETPTRPPTQDSSSSPTVLTTPSLPLTPFPLPHASDPDPITTRTPPVLPPTMLLTDPHALREINVMTSKLLDQFEADVARGGGADSCSYARFYAERIHAVRRDFWAGELAEAEDRQLVLSSA